MRLSPILTAQTAYPFVRLDEAKRRVEERGVPTIDFGIGDPREETDPAIQRALAQAIAGTSGYPRAQGLPELREAIARWARRRYDVELDADREIIPTLGSKEAIFTFAHVVVDSAGDKTSS